MAIVMRGKTRCSICGDVITDGHDIVSTPHFLWDEAHPLWRFSDSGMHQRCFAGWEHAAEFRDTFNELWPKLMPSNPREMLPDGSIVELGDKNDR
jgi:hypothetical protein